jgi:hypothetical protein
LRFGGTNALGKFEPITRENFSAFLQPTAGIYPAEFTDAWVSIGHYPAKNYGKKYDAAAATLGTGPRNSRIGG